MGQSNIDVTIADTNTATRIKWKVQDITDSDHRAIIYEYGSCRDLYNTK